MNHYIDVCLIPSVEIRENVLLNRVYTCFHKALSTLHATDIGVSFPKYKVMLGDMLRIHGTQKALSSFQSMDWLVDLAQYCTLTDILEVPATKGYRIISRKQPNMTKAKLDRLIKRGTLPAENRADYKAKMYSQGLNNPYVELISHSTKQKYRRYISFGEVVSQEQNGTFDCFGLSKDATIPWF